LLERALPSLELAAPLAEFVRATDRVPRLVEPLTIERRGRARLVLAATVHVRRTSFPPAPIEIAAESLVVRAPAAPPTPTLAQPEPAPLPVVTPEGSSAGALDVLDRGWDD